MMSHCVPLPSGIPLSRVEDYDRYVHYNNRADRWWFDKAGELIWSHVYGDERKDVAYGAARMSDGSIIVVGESNSFKRAKNFYMIRLLKGK